MDSDDDYLQDFQLFSLIPESATISLDGAAIAEGSFFVTGNHERLNWSDGDDVSVIRVSADDDLSAAFRSARSADGNQLILVDPVHENMFQRILSFMDSGSRFKTLNDSGTSIMILTDRQEAARFSIDIKRSVVTLDMANVVGKITGNRPNEYVLFSAHYDHLGIVTPVDGDSIANGANDDASGSTAVVALAKYFADSPKPERTLLFSLFTAEERGGYGAQHFSSSLNPDQIVAMFNIEMIGKPAVEGPNTAWITGFDRSTFGQILQGAVEGTEYTFYPDPYPTQNLFFRSDNATLARLGVPAHSISTTPIDVDPDYHKVSDEVSTLDLDHMTNTIKAIAAAAVTIVSGDATPSRVTIEE
jgi:Zn-dependent M28 family amino/carboxypeptidase